MNRLELYSKHIACDKKYEKIVLKCSPDNKIGYITLSSPSDLNSLSKKMLSQLSQAILWYHSHQQIKVIIINSSHPKIFCAGADIKRFVKQNVEQFIADEIFNGIQQAVKQCRKVIVAAVDGKALGGGMELALLADVIIASQKAYFALPELNLGVMPGIGGTQRLTKIIGEKMAMRYILSSEGFDGKKANQMNVAELVSSQKFDENVLNIAKKITQKATSTLMIAKRAIKFASDSNLSQGLEFEKSTFYPLFATRAAKQGISAFIQKRKPNFDGM